MQSRQSTAAARRGHVRAGARGMTMVETLVTMSIVAIVAAMAAPSFGVFVGSSNATAAQAEFLGSLQYARGEAIRRNVPVVVTGTNPVVDNGFGGGWQVWVDANGNGTFNAGEPVIRTHSAVPRAATVGNGNVQQVYFNERGYLAPANAVQLRVCPAAAGATGFRITVMPSGAFDVAEAVTCP